MSNNIVTVVQGNESIPGALSSVKFQALVTNKRIGLTQTPTGRGSCSTAGRDLYDHVAGSVRTDSYDISDGTEIGLVAERHTATRTVTKRMLLKADHRAPYIRVGMATSGHQRSIFPRLYVEGRFWVIPVDQFEEGKVLKAFLPTYEDPFVVFDQIEELHPGSPMPVVHQKTINLEGRDMKVTVKRPTRALRL